VQQQHLGISLGRPGHQSKAERTITSRFNPA
jgi:hypothetical protein